MRELKQAGGGSGRSVAVNTLPLSLFFSRHYFHSLSVHLFALGQTTSFVVIISGHYLHLQAA